MNVNRSNGFALLLIGCGVLILLGKLGFGLGGLMSYLFPLLLIGLGYIGVKQGRGFIGWMMIILGAVILLGKLSSIFGWLLAIGLILYGVSLLKDRNRVF